MSLLGRLEDLSLSDIIQIVYLSRRTGILEVTDDEGKHALVFRNGLLVNATSPEAPDLTRWLSDRGLADRTAVSTEALADAVRNRISEIIAPLLTSSEGEFNFVLANDALRLDYDPDAVFKEGGLTPPAILGVAVGQRPLLGLEQSLRAGKALVRSAQPETVVTSSPQVEDDTLPFASRNLFRVAGGLTEIESPEARMRNVLLYEREALIRVAARRAFARHDIKVVQFGSLDDTRRAVGEWFRSNEFFVTVLEVAAGSTALLREIKRKNPRLPVAMLDRESDLKRRHDLMRMGADLYLTKPVGTGEDELNLFADELVVFAERALDQWDQISAHWGLEAGKRFYEEAEREHTDRGFDLLKQFIAELSNPNDIRELADTILRLALEYLDRAVLFIVRPDGFFGVGDAGAIHLDRAEPSILADVAASGESHRGKMKKTPVNVQLIEALGGALPTEVIALPVVHNGQTIGILYGDNAAHHAPIESLAGLEIFLSQAGYAFENAVAAERSQTP